MVERSEESKESVRVTTQIAAAEAYEEQARWHEALAVWRALASKDKSLRFVLSAALAAENGGLLEDAEQLFREAMARAPERAAGYIGLGVLLVNQRRLDEARQMLECGVNLEEQPFAVTILGVVQRWLGDVRAARATLRRSLELDPNDDEAHFSLGLALVEEEPLMAVEHFRRALELDPHLPHAHRELGDALASLRRFDEAETFLRQAVIEDPADAWAHAFLGHVLNIRDDWQSAKQEFLSAAEHKPEVGRFWSDLAGACARLEQYADADRYYLKALSLAVENAQVNALYGIFLKHVGQAEKARAYLRRAVSLDPSQTRARQALDELGESR